MSFPEFDKFDLHKPTINPITSNNTTPMSNTKPFMNHEQPKKVFPVGGYAPGSYKKMRTYWPIRKAYMGTGFIGCVYDKYGLMNYWNRGRFIKKFRRREYFGRWN